MITGRKNYFRIIFGGSTGKSCNRLLHKIISGELFFECCNSPFAPVKVFGKFSGAPLLRNLCGLGAGWGQAWEGGGGPGEEGGPREPFPERERERRERERERERECTERGLRALAGTGGGALTGQGLLQEKIIGELFSGALQENPVIAPGQVHEKKCIELFW